MPLGPLSKGKKGPVSREARFSGHSCRIRCPADNKFLFIGFQWWPSAIALVTWQHGNTMAGTAQATQVMLQSQAPTSPKPVPCRLDVNLQFRLGGRSLVHTVLHSVTTLNALRCGGISQPSACRHTGCWVRPIYLMYVLTVK